MNNLKKWTIIIINVIPSSVFSSNSFSDSSFNISHVKEMTECYRGGLVFLSFSFNKFLQNISSMWDIFWSETKESFIMCGSFYQYMKIQNNKFKKKYKLSKIIFFVCLKLIWIQQVFSLWKGLKISGTLQWNKTVPVHTLLFFFYKKDNVHSKTIFGILLYWLACRKTLDCIIHMMYARPAPYFPPSRSISSSNHNNVTGAKEDESQQDNRDCCTVGGQWSAAGERLIGHHLLPRQAVTREKPRWAELIADRGVWGD